MRVPRTVGELMTACPLAVRASNSVAEAHARMRERRVHQLPVVEYGRVVGVISQRDLYVLESLCHLDTTRVQVEEVMTHAPYVVGPDEPLLPALDRMLARGFGSILVMDRDRLVGIFTAVDAVKALCRLLRAADEPELASASEATAENP